MSLTGCLFLPQGSSVDVLKGNPQFDVQEKRKSFFLVTKTIVRHRLTSKSFMFVCESELVFTQCFYKCFLGFVTFTYLKQENFPLFLAVKDRLNVEPLPNYHVGRTPLIQFGDSPACKGATLPSTKLPERFMSH